MNWIKKIATNTFLYVTLLQTTLIANCDIQTFELGLECRRDDIHLETNKSNSNYCYGKTKACSDIHFKDIDIYALTGRLRFMGQRYYVAINGSYGVSQKGRSNEEFSISNRYLFYKDHYNLHENSRIKKRSEFYDFDLVAGYPINFCGCKFSIIPLVGYGFSRQQISVNRNKHSCHCFKIDSSCNEFCSSSIDNPFESSSSSGIARQLGICQKGDSKYRFSWYGPLAGLNLLLSLDNCWSLYADAKWHFLCRAHQKRDSKTGVTFMDNYHSTKSAYGFDGLIGTYVTLCEDWYSTMEVRWKIFNSNHKNDDLSWNSISASLSIGYLF